MLTEARIRLGCRVESSAARSGGGDRCCALERVVAVVLRAPDLHWSTRGCTVKVYKGSGRAKGHQQRGITAAAELTCGGNSRKFPSVQASESRVEVLGSFLVSRRSYCGTGQGLGGGGVTGLRRCRDVCAAEHSGRVDLGLGAALEWQDRALVGAQEPNKGLR